MRNNLELKYSYEIRDSKNKIVKKAKPRKCRSWLKAAIQKFYVAAGIKTQVITDYSGVDRTYAVPMVWMSRFLSLTNNGGTTTDYGILVGSGTNAVVFTDYALQTRILHGAAAGKLSHGTVSFGAPTTTATTTSMQVTRVFTNSSGGSITVNEIGLVSYDNSYYLLIVRDLTGGIAVGNSEALTLNYIITTTI